MKACPSCGTEIADTYKWCANCVSKWKKEHTTNSSPTDDDMKTKSKAWHDDPTVDALLKINSNLGTLVGELRIIRVITELQEDDRQNNKGKTMRKKK